MQSNPEAGAIVLAEDDDDDFLLIQEAFAAAGFKQALERVKNGEELVAYLRGLAGKLPSLLLLDLNMPRKDGREVLREMREDPRLRAVPVIALTTSNSPEDVFLCYQLGVNSFVHKPVHFDDLRRVIKVLLSYWFEIAELPQVRRTNA